jgi:colanic acid biosynthesis glycosyl transferase WcaI
VLAPLAGPADVVLATTPPLFTAVAGLAIARMNAAPFVLDVRDLWPAAATSLMQISPGWETSAAETIERALYRAATVTTAVTRPFCDHIDALRGPGSSTVLLPNGTIPQFFAPHMEGEGRSGRFVVTFAGILGIAQALPAVLDAAARLAGDAEFVLVGDGPVRASLVEDARARGLTNVEFRPQLPLEAITPVLAASDALLVPLSAHPTFEQFVPSKLIDFMAVGRPVILSAAGEAARILEHAGGGIAVPPESPGELAAAVRWLAAHPREAREMGDRGRAFALRRLRSTQAERLEQVLFDAAGVPLGER